jgi:uncharacterized protein (TIGR00730 family)
MLANQDVGIVYGGGSVGLMNELAQGALAEGGEVIGVIPEKLQELELAKDDLSQLIVVPDMHARKKTMADLSDGFIALPGGFGTLEELFEATTWSQLQFHNKPVGILNIDGYFDALLAFVAHCSQEGFIRPLHSQLLNVHTDPEALIERMRHARIPELKEWIQDP